MKKTSPITFCLLLVIGFLCACGPSEEEIQRREQARQDSLEALRQQRMEQQRLDSLAQARADSIAKAKEEPLGATISFSKDGNYAVQVESWRSKTKAQSRVSTWEERGFENAFVVKYGEEDTGNIWFRVRLGRLSTEDAAKKLKQQIKEKYQAQSWISLLS